MSQITPGVEAELRKLRQEIELRNLIEVYNTVSLLDGEAERHVVAVQIRRLAGIDGWATRQVADRREAAFAEFEEVARTRLSELGWTSVTEETGAETMRKKIWDAGRFAGDVLDTRRYKEISGVAVDSKTVKMHGRVVRSLARALQLIKEGWTIEEITDKHGAL